MATEWEPARHHRRGERQRGPLPRAAFRRSVLGVVQVRVSFYHPETSDEEDDRLEDLLWQTFDESEDELRDEVNEAARLFFGPRVKSEIIINRGSIELSILLIALSALGTYRSSAENIAWFGEHVRALINRFAGHFRAQAPAGTTVETSVRTSEAPEPTRRERLIIGGESQFLFGYVLLTQTALLATLLWLLVKKA
jgi:hypothetical protein